MRKKLLPLALGISAICIAFCTSNTTFAAPWVASPGSCSDGGTTTNRVVNCTNVNGTVTVLCSQYPGADTLTLTLNGVSQTINCGGICGSAAGKGYCDQSEISYVNRCNDDALESDARNAGITNQPSEITEDASTDHLWTWTCTVPNTVETCYADFGTNCGTGGTNVGCGGANGGTFSSAPTSGLCLISSTASEVEEQGSFWAWDCTSSSGEVFNCLASKGGSGGGGDDDGDGGGDGGDGGVCAAPPAGEYCTDNDEVGGTLCADGYPSPSNFDSQETGPWSWICENENGGTLCSTNAPADGDGNLPASICGTLNGQQLANAPELSDPNLCKYGSVVANKIYGDGPWMWSCKHSWLTSVCMADQKDSNIFIIGQTRSESLEGAELDEESESEIGSVQLNEYSQIVNYNIATLTKNLAGLAGGNVILNSEGVPTSSNYDQPNANVYYIKDGNLIFSSETNFNFTQPTTYIVDGGDVIIKNNLSYTNNGSVGIIVLQSDEWSTLNNDNRGGNVYIEPNVTDTVGTFYMQGSLLAAQDSDANKQISDNEIFYGRGTEFTIVEATLHNQLYHQGIIISRNTIYGSREESGSTLFALPFLAVEDADNVGERYLNLPNTGITSIAQYKSQYYDICSASNADEQSICTSASEYESYQDFARRFDLNYFRVLDRDGAHSPNIQALFDTNKISENTYSKSFIIHYDNKVQDSTPPGFEGSI